MYCNKSSIKNNFVLWFLILFTLWIGHVSAEETNSTGKGASIDHKPIDVSKLVNEKCLMCHAHPGPWPNLAKLAKLSSDDIYYTLWAGLMREIAVGLNDAERKAIAQYISGMDANKPSLTSGGVCNSVIQPKTAYFRSLERMVSLGQK